MKSILGPLFNPLTLALVLVVWALLHKRRRIVLLCTGMGVLCLFGYPPGPWMLRKPLVTQYAPVTGVQAGITNIVVLSAGRFATDTAVPVNGRAAPEYLYRFLEGVRLQRNLPGSRMLVSVSIPADLEEARSILNELAALVGVEPERLVPVVGATDTRTEAQLMRDAVGTNAFYLVTSAVHMPRAMLLCKQAGLQPLAAPAGLCARGDWERPLLASLYPSSENLRATDQAIHEYLGMLWARLTR